MDLVFLDAEPSAAEIAAVDAVLGPPGSGWEGGRHTPADDRVARLGHAIRSRRDELLPALHALQDEIGWITEGGLDYVCKRLSIPPAEAYGVAVFYALLSTKERPPVVAHVCDDTACRAAGVTGLIDDLADALGPPGHDRGGSMWLTSPCLGQCDRGSAAFIQIAGEPNAVIAPVTIDGLTTALGGVPGEAMAGTGAPQAPNDTLPVLSRVGIVDAHSLNDYRRTGGYEALQRALEIGPDAVVTEVEASGLRGRGGAAFPTAIKWRAVSDHPSETKYVVGNADESETGTYKDRVLMENDPYAFIEGMTIAGFATGASEGFIYIRAEYPVAEARLRHALDHVRHAGLLGDHILGSDFEFDIEIRRGAGAYICGEETALFNSIEGYRGEPRTKPPYPTEAGLFGKPTVVNNVETLVNVPIVLRDGAAAYAARGTTDSSGTKLFCLSGAVAMPGVYEVVFGTTLGQLIELAGGATGDVKAVLVGGAAGSFVDHDGLDTPLSFESASLGSGAVVVFDTDADMLGAVRRIAAFFRDEACGQCIPCRVGTVRQEEALARMATGSDETELLDDLAAVLRDSSICGLGQLAADAVQSAVRLELIR